MGDNSTETTGKCTTREAYSARRRGKYMHALQWCPTVCKSTRLRWPQDLPGKNTGEAYPCPSGGSFPDPGMEPASLISLALAGGFFVTSAAWET